MHNNNNKNNKNNNNNNNVELIITIIIIIIINQMSTMRENDHVSFREMRVEFSVSRVYNMRVAGHVLCPVRVWI